MQARLRAQLGDRSEYSGERRRRSVVVASIVLTITDPLRGSFPFLVLSPSCAHSLLRSYIRLHGVNHNQPFPTAEAYSRFLPHLLFPGFFSALAFGMFQCKHQCVNALETSQRHIPTLWHYRFGRFNPKSVRIVIFPVISFLDGIFSTLGV